MDTRFSPGGRGFDPRTHYEVTPRRTFNPDGAAESERRENDEDATR